MGIIFEVIKITWMIVKSSRNFWKFRTNKKSKTTAVIHRNEGKISVNTDKISPKHMILLLIEISATERGISVTHDQSIWVNDFLDVGKYCLTMKLTSELAIFTIISTIYEYDIKRSSVVFLYKDCAILMDEC